MKTIYKCDNCGMIFRWGREWPLNKVRCSHCGHQQRRTTYQSKLYVSREQPRFDSKRRQRRRMKIVKIYRERFGNTHMVCKGLDCLLNEVRTFFEADEVGERLWLVRGDMPEGEYNKLPEFEG